MTNRIPDGITADHLIAAIRKIQSGEPNRFAESTGYDVLFESKRFSPKAVVGVAAEALLGKEFGPYDFKGGLKSKCFKILEDNGFEIVTKGDNNPFPEQVYEDGHYEGAVLVVQVNKYERDQGARKACIRHYGASCQVCGFDFGTMYGALGDGFIHVHHIVPIFSVGQMYQVDPIEDLRPVCPNCHAMLHKRTPPFSLRELHELISRRDRG